MNVPPVSVERVQKCVVNFEIYRFLKKAANLPHPPLQYHTRPLIHFQTSVLSDFFSTSARGLAKKNQERIY